MNENSRGNLMCYFHSGTIENFKYKNDASIELALAIMLMFKL